MKEDNAAGPKTRAMHRKIVRQLTLVAVGMFGFGFAMVPLYDVFCEVTGFGGRSIQVSSGPEAGAAVSDRKVRIHFVATANSALPWVFQPMDKTATVQLGELSETSYMALNPTENAIIGHATYNVSPPEASLYFVKTECFCFTQQLLRAQETREMPVYYFVQADLPEHIREITLSYTFYRDESNAAALALASAESQD